MIYLYRILFLPLFFLFLPKYVFHMVKRGGYWADIKYRFGIIPKIEKSTSKKRIWLQAVSVGEINAIENFVDLLSSDERIELFITSTTSTGYALAKKKYSSKVKFVGIFPWDFYFFSKFSWDNIRPDVAILAESELWPEHIFQANNRNVPLYIVNGRISDVSFKYFKILKYFAKKLLNYVNVFFVSGQKTFERIIYLGVDKSKVELCGNMKFDCNACILSDEQIIFLKKECGFSENDKVILGSSTWPGEEAMLVEALSEIRKSCDYDWKLLICPRHSERREEIAKILNKSSFKWHQRSSGIAKENVDICLADTTGELKNLTQIVQFAFIGKSLAPNIGGQSPLDCAAYGIPMIYGNFMTNFEEICKELESNSCVVKVDNNKSAIEFLVKCAKDLNLCQNLAKNVKQWHMKHVGASKNTYENLIKRIF